MKKFASILLSMLMATGAIAAASAETYTGTAQGIGEVSVTLTVEDGKITAAEVVGENETKGIGYEPCADGTYADAIVAAQGVDFDSISGATVTSNAVKDATKKAMAAAGLIEAEDTTVADAECDVVIVGAGGAGLSAAVAATDEGASVILIEKEGYVGGNTLVSGGIFNCPDEDMQKEVEMTAGVKLLVESALAETPVSEEHAQLIAKVKEQYDAHNAAGKTYLFDSVEWFTLQTWNAGDKVADLKLVYTMCENAYDTMTWLHDLGWTYKSDIRQGAGSLYQRTHSSVDHAGVGFINALSTGLEGRDAQIVYSTTAKELVMQDGKCVGVVAEDRDGNTITFHANKNVILATGGFARNKEMLAEYNTSGKWPDLTKITGTNMPGITGDGIRMALWAGAELEAGGACMIWNRAILPDGFEFNEDRMGGDIFLPGSQPFLHVNVNGERFMNEDQCYPMSYAAGANQPKHYSWIVWDSKGSSQSSYPAG